MSLRERVLSQSFRAVDAEAGSQPSSSRCTLSLSLVIKLVAWLLLAIGAGVLVVMSGGQSSGLQPMLKRSKTQLVTPVQYTMDELKFAAAYLNPEVMVHGPLNEAAFLADYLSPCWNDDTSQMRCLPHLIIMGGFHSGAGTLTRAIEQHPDVASDASSGSQFWAEDGKTMQEYNTGWSSAVKRVQAQPNKTVVLDSSQSTFAFYWAAAGKAHRAFGSTVRPCHANCSADMEKYIVCMDTVCLPAARAADQKLAKQAGIDYDLDQHLPLIMRALYMTRPPRLVALLRNPLDRLHSAYYGYPHYHGKFGDNPEGFLAYVQDLVGAFKNCSSLHGDLACTLRFETLGMEQEKVYFHVDQLLRGMYSVYVETWLRFFPDSLLLLKSEDFFGAGATKVLQQVQRHAGLEPWSDEEAAQKLAAVTVPKHVKGRPMLPVARELLTDFYRPHIQNLAEITGRGDYLDWLKPPASDGAMGPATTMA
ncbi:P-loop containing nucleoside triphosphate hydrolase protein [Haematococcus lacustris]